jgi:hypothetical protein
MNCQRNVNSILPTQLPHKFSYVDAILIHNNFESPNEITNMQINKQNGKISAEIFILLVELCVIDAI